MVLASLSIIADASRKKSARNALLCASVSNTMDKARAPSVLPGAGIGHKIGILNSSTPIKNKLNWKAQWGYFNFSKLVSFFQPAFSKSNIVLVFLMERDQ
jgi:hypothetical protein